MEEEIWRDAIAAVAYELARRNGDSPLDRGAALGRMVEAYARERDLPQAFELFKAERAYRGEESGFECAARVEAMVYGVAPRSLLAA